EATSTCPIDIRSLSSVFVSYVQMRSTLHKRQSFPIQQTIIRVGASTVRLQLHFGRLKGIGLKIYRAAIRAICGTIAICGSTLSAQTAQIASTSEPVKEHVLLVMTDGL